MIDVKNLSFAYRQTNREVVRGIDFHVGQGEIFGFLGPSGAGKSTTQKILTRQLGNYSGEIDILNKSLKLWDHSFFELIGVGFELPNHYLKLTALENLEFFASFYKRKISPPIELLDRVGLSIDVNKKVEGYSKGMKMRLNFVRALMHDPQIIFLDEPTSGLDPVNARKIKDIILDLKQQGKTIFLTTHNMHDAEELCDRVAFIVEGELKLIDSPRNMKLEHGKRLLTVEYENGNKKSEQFDLDTLSSNLAFMNLVQNCNIVSMHSQEASLDEIFIKTTGTNLS